MSVVDAFLSTWSRARDSFGEGTPQDGAGLDHSARLESLRDDVEAAGPGSDWTGPGAEGYGDRNARQARTLGAMADLDRRLAAELGRSAAVVAAGRRELDAVRQWVEDAVATVPATPTGERMLWPVVSRGAGEIAEIIERSHRDLDAIAARMRAIGAEYEQLGRPGL
nr:EspA/EspE family type VII secretion system effector [Mycolicibacterium malmesburyense]CRL67477.1 Biofilm regulator BssS [Mycolicibacterium malmesburyense]